MKGQCSHLLCILTLIFISSNISTHFNLRDFCVNTFNFLELLLFLLELLLCPLHLLVSPLKMLPPPLNTTCKKNVLLACPVDTVQAGHGHGWGIAGLLVTYPSDPICCTYPQRPPPPDSSCFTVILKYPLFLGSSFYELNSFENACPLANPDLLQ